MEEQKFQMDFAGRPLVIEVGKLAKQASPSHRPSDPSALPEDIPS